MTLIGRKEEQRKLSAFLGSGKAEFVVVYGRRRVGKTFLVSEFFRDTFAFHATGLSKGKMADQLAVFDAKLSEYGMGIDSPSKSWLQAFSRLKELLQAPDVARDAGSGRKVVFIDEMPWFDTPRSGFRGALEFFWNDWASRQKDLILIACGSATSWIARNLLEDKGGLHNRVTRIIDLRPFTAEEMREYFLDRGMALTPQQEIECSMVFGGVPFYLDLLEREASLAQNIDSLCFSEGGQLRHEFERLYTTLFKHPGAHMDIVRALAGRAGGMTRAQMRRIKGLEGSRLTGALYDLELCGFVRRYNDFTKPKNGAIYQLVDPFTLFHLKCIEPGKIGSWLQHVGSASYHAWAGLAFEMYCINNVELIKEALGISGVQTSVCAWRSEGSDPGAQIDLLIDRRDGVINVCEMKFSQVTFAIDADYARKLERKIAVFREEAHPKKALYLTMVTANGVKRNNHYHAVVQSDVVLHDVFA